MKATTEQNKELVLEAFGFLPVNWIAADIVRVEDGLLVEHWDVIQDEATQEASKSKAPMFGTRFPIYPDRNVSSD